MLKISETKTYRKNLKLMLKQGKKLQKIYDVIKLILDNANKGVEYHLLLPEKYRLHKLSNGIWDCHITPIRDKKLLEI